MLEAVDCFLKVTNRYSITYLVNFAGVITIAIRTESAIPSGGVVESLRSHNISCTVSEKRPDVSM
eukprot:scaffold334_cov191-Alexandrium_tamarense.AAC.4